MSLVISPLHRFAETRIFIKRCKGQRAKDKGLITFMQKTFTFFIIFCFLLTAACQTATLDPSGANPGTLGEVSAQRLNFRFEADVPDPPASAPNGQSDERIPAIQNDFDVNRSLEILEKTITSPDKQKVLVVYHKVSDQPSEFRLDMYSPDGKILKKVTPEAMAVHFPDTIQWSPDSQNAAFVAMLRAGQGGMPLPNANTNSNTDANTQTNTNTETNVNTNTADPEANANAEMDPTPDVPGAATDVLIFRTEQIYLTDASGDNLKLLTQNEGLIYFYYVWSPNSAALAALAVTSREWQFLEYQAQQKGEVFSPMGRPRMVEKNGRERRLDDNLTKVRPVWSPDSAKIGAAFEKQVRIYDAVSETPTQAAIPLRNQLLIASAKYEKSLQANEGVADTNTADSANQTNPPEQDGGATLPDEASLVSFNPIIALEWTQPDLLYVQTGYVIELRVGDGARSYLRWHRLVLSPQAEAIK